MELPTDSFLDGYVRITPEAFAARCCIRAQDALQLAIRDVSAWAFVISDLHTALNSAMVAALRGSAEIGAYADREFNEWAEWLEDGSRKGKPAPKSERVAEFRKLLERATSPEWSIMLGGDPIVLSSAERKDIEKLHLFRSDLLHVKPKTWSLEAAGLPRICGAAASALKQLFELPSVYLHLEGGLYKEAKQAIDGILDAAAQFPSSPPWEE
ncbi:hypothetical protein [Dongia sp.]|uniref:hypothetical protein n=1 Tax=Dongia sp. TaxID=1977262 RepID=UPI0035AFEE3A